MEERHISGGAFIEQGLLFWKLFLQSQSVSSAHTPRYHPSPFFPRNSYVLPIGTSKQSCSSGLEIARRFTRPTDVRRYPCVGEGSALRVRAPNATAHVRFLAIFYTHRSACHHASNLSRHLSIYPSVRLCLSHMILILGPSSSTVLYLDPPQYLIFGYAPSGFSRRPNPPHII